MILSTSAMFASDSPEAVGTEIDSSGLSHMRMDDGVRSRKAIRPILCKADRPGFCDNVSIKPVLLPSNNVLGLKTH
jgi:hypothetical protein